MNTFKKIIKNAMLPLLVAGAVFSSCNKDVKQFDIPATPVYPSSANSIAKTIAANPNDSLYYRMIVRAGMVNVLNDSSRSYTVFATDNNGMKIFVNAASGGAVPLAAPDAVFSAFIAGTLPAASAAGIIQYNTVGQKYTFGSFPIVFPNFPLPTSIILDPTNQFVRMQIFPSRQTPTSYVNTIPVISTDQVASNGIIHHTYTVVSPASATLKTLIAAEPTLSYFRAAIARADSGSAGTNRFDSLLNYGVTNMTVLTPNDVAFQNFIYALVYGKTFAATGSATIAAATAAGAVAAGPAFLSTNNVLTSDVRGIMAYHFLAGDQPAGSTAYTPNIRVFSVNLPASAPKFIKTLVNGSFPTHPGVMAIATFTGPTVTTLTFNGVGTIPPGGAPYSGPAATAVAKDKFAVNGVYHIIDKVLLPQ